MEKQRDEKAVEAVLELFQKPPFTKRLDKGALLREWMKTSAAVAAGSFHSGLSGDRIVRLPEEGDYSELVSGVRTFDAQADLEVPQHTFDTDVHVYRGNPLSEAIWYAADHPDERKPLLIVDSWSTPGADLDFSLNENFARTDMDVFLRTNLLKLLQTPCDSYTYPLRDTNGQVLFFPNVTVFREALHLPISSLEPHLPEDDKGGFYPWMEEPVDVAVMLLPLPRLDVSEDNSAGVGELPKPVLSALDKAFRTALTAAASLGYEALFFPAVGGDALHRYPPKPTALSLQAALARDFVYTFKHVAVVFDELDESLHEDWAGRGVYQEWHKILIRPSKPPRVINIPCAIL